MNCWICGVFVDTLDSFYTSLKTGDWRFEVSGDARQYEKDVEAFSCGDSRMFAEGFRVLNMYSGVSPRDGCCLVDRRFDVVRTFDSLFKNTPIRIVQEANPNEAEGSLFSGDIQGIIVHEACLDILTGELNRRRVPWTYRGITTNACLQPTVMNLDFAVPGFAQHETDTVAQKFSEFGFYDASNLMQLQHSALLALPSEILNNMMRFLDEASLISLFFACKFIGAEPGFWRRMFAGDAVPGMDWHAYYRRATRFRMNLRNRARITAIVRHNIPMFETWNRRLRPDIERIANAFLAARRRCEEDFYDVHAPILAV
ncbi:hypothetical protein DL89DRAFT_268929 [Linderina pennispora]|uniref:F-box domain-containing protein n=1 Tax=Linderina pennispora TaxID=61395 RepID=A0A1Y1W4J9_9FUNG|nr:uncharacterized protein DL89DRAFT_268929 [Linderina pennispora]ORX68417.1 hypothetical protein DL89DRAFT_268929 [Linderina pennispora]